VKLYFQFTYPSMYYSGSALLSNLETKESYIVNLLHTSACMPIFMHATPLPNAGIDVQYLLEEGNGILFGRSHEELKPIFAEKFSV